MGVQAMSESRQRNLIRRQFLAVAATSMSATLLNSRARGAPATPDEFIADSMRANRVAGLAACVIRRDRPPWSRGFGWADLERRVPMSADSLLNIGSVSKTITATAVMQLWEQENVDLDRDVNDYLPFAVRNPKFPDAPITVRQLLTHTSSIADGRAYEPSYACGDPTVTLADWVRGYFTPGGPYHDAESNFHAWNPGQGARYSNVGFGLLGYLVEAVAGMDFAKYCRRHIFEPLRMKNTSWFLADLDREKHAIPYAYVDKPGASVEVLRETGRVEVARERPGHVAHCLYSFPNYPDGLVRTSVNQLARFLTAYVGDGGLQGQRILKPATVRKMLSPQRAAGLGPDDEVQGLAWHTLRDDDGKATFWGHTGGDPGISTLMAFRPGDGVGVIVFENAAESKSLIAVSKRLLRDADRMVP